MAPRKLPILLGLALLVVAFPAGTSGITVLEAAEDNGATMFASLARKCAYLNHLLETSEGANGLTLFAFSNRAYDSSPAAFKKLVNDTQALQWVLEYHVSFGPTMRQDIKDNLLLTSLFQSPPSGSSLPLQYIRANIYNVYAEKGKLGANGKVVAASGASIVTADRLATNGIVHIVDKVMFPIPTGVDMAEYLGDDATFSTLSMYLKNANLTKALEVDASQPLTIFAPTNTAFANLPKDVVAKLKNVTFLKDVLLYHVVPNALYACGLYDNQSLHPLDNKPLLVERGQGGIYVQNSKVIMPDITVTNGVVHGISAVMIPPK